MTRRLLAAASITFILGALIAVAPLPTAAATPFTDIGGSKFAADINWAYNNGITVGCSATRFCPKGLVTREQMATFLVRMFHLPTTSQDYFTDDESSKHELSINRLRAADITFGCSTNRFCPTGTVTREQMASFIARAADLSVGAGRNYFWDDNGRTHEANVDRMAAAGMTSGCDTYKFCPTGSVTREQMAAFLHRVVAPRTAPAYPAPPPPTPQPSNCHSSYLDHCLRVGIGDWDCAGGSGNGPNYVPVRVRVIGPDEYGLDNDHDGFGCDNLG